jgi:hypothetical protein
LINQNVNTTHAGKAVVSDALLSVFVTRTSSAASTAASMFGATSGGGGGEEAADAGLALKLLCRSGLADSRKECGVSGQATGGGAPSGQLTQHGQQQGPVYVCEVPMAVLLAAADGDEGAGGDGDGDGAMLYRSASSGMSGGSGSGSGSSSSSSSGGSGGSKSAVVGSQRVGLYQGAVDGSGVTPMHVIACAQLLQVRGGGVLW